MHGRRAEASIAVPFVLVPGLGGHGWNDNDPAIPGDFNPRDVHTGAADGLDRSGHVLLPECGGGARHWITVAKSAYAQSSAVPRAASPPRQTATAIRLQSRRKRRPCAPLFSPARSRYRSLGKVLPGSP